MRKYEPYFAIGPERQSAHRQAGPQYNSFKSKVMEFLNKIQIRGVVGRADISTFSNNSQVCNFSVVTDYSTVDRDGNPAIETTWFNVSAWNGKEGIAADFYEIQKGVWVDVTGRIRMRKYTTQAGEERISAEVIARRVKLIPREDDQMQPQRDW